MVRRFSLRLPLLSPRRAARLIQLGAPICADLQRRNTTTQAGSVCVIALKATPALTHASLQRREKPMTLYCTSRIARHCSIAAAVIAGIATLGATAPAQASHCA